MLKRALIPISLNQVQELIKIYKKKLELMGRPARPRALEKLIELIPCISGGKVVQFGD